MRSDIDTLKLDKKEVEFIEDYFKYIRQKINYPTHPEIVVGMVRYPVGRFRLRRELAKKFLRIRRGYIAKKRDKPLSTNLLNFYNNYLDNLEKVITIAEEIKTTGKIVNSEKRNGKV